MKTYRFVIDFNPVIKNRIISVYCTGRFLDKVHIMLSVCLSYIKYNAGVNTYNTECPLYSFFVKDHTHTNRGV